MEILRKLTYYFLDKEVAFAVGIPVYKGEYVIREIVKVSSRDYEIYISKTEGDEITLWKKVHLPDSIFRQEEYDAKISLC